MRLKVESRIRIKVNSEIRICIKVMRIFNPAFKSKMQIRILSCLSCLLGLIFSVFSLWEKIFVGFVPFSYKFYSDSI
jgi:hypothetical protein